LQADTFAFFAMAGSAGKVMRPATLKDNKGDTRTDEATVS